MTFTRTRTFFWAFSLLASPVSAQKADYTPDSTQDKATADLPELEEFVAEETGDDFLGKSIMQTSGPAAGVYPYPMDLTEIPRAVTNITPETMEDFGIRGLQEIQRVSANTTQANTFGIAGIPYIRGRNANVFFNGMRKLYQRNEAPTSVYGAESMVVVKGAAPAYLGPSRIGGYVNLVPKAPNLSESEGHIQATVGSYDFFQGQIDGSTPFTVGDMPGAFRASVTGQRANSYYNNVENNFIEAFASAVIQLDENNSIFTGGEFFYSQANENPGWNRVTQDLIDNGRYITGTPVDLTSGYAGGRVGKGSVPGYGGAFATGVFAPGSPLSTPIPEGRIGANAGPIPFPDNPDGSQVTNGPYPAGTQFGALIPSTAFISNNATPTQVALLGPNGEYTPQYLAAGGPVETQQIAGNQVLVDPEDVADSQDFLYFLDWENTADPDRKLENKLYLEYFGTKRRSSYGFSIEADQFAIEDRFSVTQKADDLFKSGEKNTIVYGASFRYTFAKMLRDFDAEPFSRRDVSKAAIPDNTRVATGDQLNADGTNNWSYFSNASIESDLYETGIFTNWHTEWNDWLQTVADLRGELLTFDSRQPSEPNYPAQNYIRFAGETADASGTRGGGGAGFSPIVTVTEGINLYATVNYTTTQLFESTNAVRGADSFGQATLYEVGAKAQLFDNTLYAGVAAYYFDEDRLQAQNANQLKVRGEGLEFETTWAPNEWFSLLGTAGYQRVYLRNDLPFRFQYAGQRLPLVAGGNFASGGDPTGLVSQNNPDKVVPVVPEFTANLFAIVQTPIGLGAGIGPSYRASYWLNYEHTLKAPSAVIWNAIAFYRQENWEVLVELTNLFSEEYFLGGTDFASNTLVTQAAPIEAKVTLTWRW